MITTTDDGFIFSTEGVGHGLGLSFYGAYLLGEQGSVCGEILEHYYNDITIAYKE
jgi:stage II sporulation protein D